MVEIHAPTLILGAVAVALGVYLPAIFAYVRRCFVLSRLPSPPVKSLLGGHVGAFHPLQKHLYENEVTMSLGTVYRLRYYWQNTIMIADPRLQQEIFDLERAGAVEKPSFTLRWRSAKGKQEPSVVSEKTNHPMWRIVRKGTLPAFSPQNMRHYHTHITEVVGRLVDGIRRKGPDALINIADIAQRESFDVIGKVGYGEDFQASRDIDNTVNNTFRLISDDLEELVKRIVMPLRQYARGKDVDAAEEVHKKVVDIVSSLVDTCEARSPEENGNSIAGHLLKLRDPAGKEFSRARMIEEFKIFFIAGSETTGHTIAWTLYFLMKNPAALARLEAELDQAGLLRSARNPDPRAFAFSDIGKLRWLDACIKESMRLQPVVATPLRRVAARDVTLSSGVLIPAGTIIELASYSLSRNPAWGWTDPEAYKPERWEEDDAEYYVHSSGKAAPAGGIKAVHVNAVSHAGTPGPNGAEEDLEVNAATDTNIKARRYRPFGAGVRNCLGQQLAYTNIPTAIAMLLANFSMELSEEDAKKDIKDLGMSKGTLQPVNGIHVRCMPR